MPRAKYCLVQTCDNFKGATAETHMFRFPTQSDQKKLWLDIINKHNDVSHKTNGNGFVCDLHFSTTDILEVYGKLKLNKNAVPVYFNTEYELVADDFNVTHNSEQSNGHICNKCDILNIEINKLNKENFKAEINSNLKQLEKDDQIEKLRCRFDDQSLIIKSLREQISSLKTALGENKNEIKKLQLQTGQFSDIDDKRSSEIINCLVNGQSRLEKYPRFVREFALNLHFYSPRAYDFVRETFKGNLPHPVTLKKWYANSDLSSKPGITDKSIEFLKKKVEHATEAGNEVLCSLSFDEIYIRKQVTWSQELGYMRGYVTYGMINNEKPAIAKEAIVFIVSGINERFSIPVAYHFVNSLDASQKLELVKSVLKALFLTGLQIANITFDGHPTNLALCKMLGANLNVYDTNFRPSFLYEGREIFLLLDVCHMEKLVRGQLDKKGVLIDENGDNVCWNYIENLVKFSYEKGFSSTHKLKKSHIEWRKRPMNVRIAVETLSKSTADSIEYLQSKGFKEFDDSNATIRFIRLFNDLFDVLNTKFVDDNPNVYKNRMCNSNKNAIYTLFDEATSYIKKLKFKSEHKIRMLCRSEARVGFIGFIVDMYSLRSIYEKYVEEEKMISSIPTYFFNQDVVEMFFGKIRSRGGCDDNPDVIRFEAAYRKLLAFDSILQSKRGNCEAFQINTDPFSDILYVSSKRVQSVRKSDHEDDVIVPEEVEDLHRRIAAINSSIHLTDDLQNFTVAHIANAIEEKIKSTDTCEHCIRVFDSCKKVDGTFFGPNFMQKPCTSTYKICKEADQFLQLQLLKGNINFETIHYSILNNIDIELMYGESDFSCHASHKLYLIRTVVDGYIQIKGLFMARTATEDLHTEKFRYKFKKLIHFYGQ